MPFASFSYTASLRLVLLALLLGTTPSEAATCVWNGPVSGGVWSTSANWLNCSGRPPVAGDSVEIPAFPFSSSSNDLTDLSLVQLRFFGDHQLSGNEIRLSGGLSANATGPVALRVDAPITVLAPQTFTCAGAQPVEIRTLRLNAALAIENDCRMDLRSVSGSSSLTKRGAGLLQLESDIVHSGGTTIVAGIVTIRGFIGGNGDVIIHSGATLEIRGFGLVLRNSLSIAGNGADGNGALRSVSFATTTWTGPVTLNSNATFAVPDNATLAITAPVEGIGGLIKTGTGTLTLGAANSYHGPTTVAAGVLQVESGGALAPGNLTRVEAGATLALHNATIGGAALELVGSGPAAAPSLHGVDGDAAWIGPVALVGDAQVRTELPESTLVLAGPVSGGNLLKTGPGRLTLAGQNSHAGATLIAEGTLRVDSAAALGASGAPGTIVTNGTTLELSGGFDLFEPLDLRGLGVAGRGALRSVGGMPSLRGPILLNDVVRVDAGADAMNIEGVVSGAGGLDKVGPGRLVLAGANTYGGPTRVFDGTVRIASNDALGVAATGTDVLAGGTLELVGSLATDEPLVLNGNGGGNGALRSVGGMSRIDGAVDIASAAQIAVVDSVLTLAGPMNGNAGLTKTGAGTLTLGGVAAAPANGKAYTGTTTVASGTLSVLGETGAVVVEGDARLTGNGTLGNVALLAGGVVAPSGVLTAHDFTWHGGGLVDLELGPPEGPSDRLHLEGGLLRGSGSGFEFRFADAAAGRAQQDVAYVLASYASTTFVASEDFSHSYNGALGGPMLTGAFFLFPERLEFEAIEIPQFIDGFE